MNNTLSKTFDYAGVGLNWLVYAVNTNETLQMALFILSIISTIIVFLKNVIPLIVRFVEWCKTSFKDGKIDEEEQAEIADILDQTQKAIEEAKEDIENAKK